MAYRDNLAYKMEYAPAYEPLMPAPHIRPATAPAKPQSKTKAKAKPRRAGAFFMAAILVIGAFLVLYRAASITMLTNEVGKKQKELADLQAANQQTQLELDRSLDLKKVEEVATQKLGMRRPEKYQTVYVDINNADYVEHTAKDSGGLLSTIGGFFQGIKEYLD